jgi:glycine cleavage system H protein
VEKVPIRYFYIINTFTGGTVMSIPNNLRYSEEHEWVKTEGNEVVIGITHFAQGELGDIVFVELPEVGATIEANEPFGSVESVKTVSELYAPVSGKVVAVNEELSDQPELVNESPYEGAWMVKVELSDASQVEKLLTAEKYAEMTNQD